MGCWNGTCGISQIAIRAGEPTIGFLMVRNPGDKWSANGHCYTTEYWCPLSLHIKGTYNDYGGLEDVDENDWSVEVAHKYIIENMIERDEGENKYHDIAVKKDDLGWENLSEAMHEDRIELEFADGFMKEYYPNTTGLQVGLMMVHKKVFDAIIEQGIDYWGGAITMDSLMKDGKDIVAYFRENDRTINGAVTDSEKALAEILMDHGMDMVCRDDHDNHLRQITISSEGANFNAGKVYLRYLSEKVYEGYTDEQLDVIIKKLSEFYIFQSAMSMMRKTWMPQAGSGGQSDEPELYTAVNKTVDGIIAERAAERAEWENEDE